MRTGSQFIGIISLLAFHSAHWFDLHSSQLVSVCVLEEENNAKILSVDISTTFIFIAQKVEMVKCKLRPKQKQLHYAQTAC